MQEIVPTDATVQRQRPLDYLRGCVVLLVVIHHCVSGYARFGFFDPHSYLRSSSPILDERRWIGFDVFLMFTETFFMSLMFLLSGLFVRGSLRRRGALAFVRGRLLRLGLPYLLGIAAMPLGYYPSYVAGGGAASLGAYWWETLRHGPRPNGPLWFIAVLLLFDLAAALAFRLWPNWPRRPASWCAARADRPASLCVALLLLTWAAYLPMLAAFGPDRWIVLGTAPVQASRILLYAAYFATGIVIGAAGPRLLARDAGLARASLSLCAGAGVAYVAYVAWRLAGTAAVAGPLWRMLGGVLFGLECGAVCLACLAAFQHARRSKLLDRLRDCFYAVYLVHYLPMIWLQAALAPMAWPVLLKALAALAGTLALSCVAAMGLRQSRVARAVI